MARTSAAVALLLVVGASAVEVSPVQKVIELLEECKGKIVKDLKAEEEAMTEYTAFCDKELEEKAYAIKTAERSLMDLKADGEDAEATMSQLSAEIEALGTEMAAKDKELATTTATRNQEKATFEKTEKELLGTVDELTRAVAEVKKGMSFLQVKNRRSSMPLAHMKAIAAALSKVVDAAWVQQSDRKVITKFLQQASGDEDDLSLHGTQEREKAGGVSGFLETLEDMKDKAEEALTTARGDETKAGHAFDMMEQGLHNELKVAQDKKNDASTALEAQQEESGKAAAELAETEKTKAADEAYVASLSSECQVTAKAWEERQAEAKEEMAAVDKAKEILSSGVKVFVQVRASLAKDDGDDLDVDGKRSQLVGKLKKLARTYHSFALMEMVTAASADPFGKIRGLIEDMIAKLINEANEEATQKAFCDEEMGKSKKSQTEKTMEKDKLTARADKAETAKATLEQSIKELEEEIAGIDKAQAEATKMRTEEHAEYEQSSKDFKDSAEATEQAIVVLKQYYEGALIQTAIRKAGQPEFGGAKGDTGHSIISILEMAAEDFTKTYTEIESEEAEAAASYKKLAQENKVARSTKEAEAKGKASEVKSLSVELENAKSDIDGVSKELDAVLEYLAKLKPQCESKAMSYEEKKQRREAEIEGLKEALKILEGSA